MKSRTLPDERADGGRGKGRTTHVYSGTRNANGTTVVVVDGQPLETDAALRSGPATTFDWGYDGQGAPAQLALAMLAHHLGPDQAKRNYKRFLRGVVRGLPRPGWAMTGADIDAALLVAD